MRLATTLLALAFLAAPFASAQTPAATSTAAPACEGFPAVVRVSEIKLGAMPNFLKAVDAHQAWYRAHGSLDPIFATRIYARDPDTHASSLSETEILTFHLVLNRDQKLPENDDAWKAFVQMYKDSSTIKSEYHTCMPKPMQ